MKGNDVTIQSTLLLVPLVYHISSDTSIALPRVNNSSIYIQYNNDKIVYLTKTNRLSTE